MPRNVMSLARRLSLIVLTLTVAGCCSLPHGSPGPMASPTPRPEPVDVYLDAMNVPQADPDPLQIDPVTRFVLWRCKYEFKIEWKDRATSDLINCHPDPRMGGWQCTAGPFRKTGAKYKIRYNIIVTAPGGPFRHDPDIEVLP